MHAFARVQKSPREEAREARRAIEAALQQELAARRVRRVDSAGRAYATGRRKTSVARVWIWPGPGSVVVNRRTLDMHFPELQRRAEILSPFQARPLFPLCVHVLLQPRVCLLSGIRGCVAHTMLAALLRACLPAVPRRRWLGALSYSCMHCWASKKILHCQSLAAGN